MDKILAHKMTHTLEGLKMLSQIFQEFSDVLDLEEGQASTSYGRKIGNLMLYLDIKEDPENKGYYDLEVFVSDAQ